MIIIGRKDRNTKKNVDNELTIPPSGGLVETSQYKHERTAIRMTEQMVEIVFAQFTISVSGRIRSNLNNLKFPYSMFAGSLDFERRLNSLESSERKEGYLKTRIITIASNPQPGFRIEVKSPASINQILVSHNMYCQRAGASLTLTHTPP